MQHRQLLSSRRRRFVRDSLTFLVPLLVFILVLVFPFDRSMGAMVRHGFNFWLFAAGLVLYLGFRLERYTGWWLSFLPTSILFGLALAGLWENAFSEMQVVSGMLYFSDASQYHADALRLLHGFPYSSFSARHPLPTIFLTILLWMSQGNLQIAIAGLVFCSALSIYLAARAVFKTWGAFAAASFILIIFLFHRRFIGMLDSENLGLTLGCLAFAYLSHTSSRPGHVSLTGLLLLSLGLAARPGAFLILPAVLVWFVFSGHAQALARVKRFLVAGLILSSGLSLTFFANALLAEPGSAMYSNLAYTLYGIAQGGKGWEQFLADYPGYVHQPAVEAERFAYQQAFQAFVSHPEIALRGLIRSAAGYFTLKDNSLFGYLCGGEMTAFNRAAPPGRQKLYQGLRLVVMILTVIGAGKIWQGRKSTPAALSLSVWLGWFLSLPFIPAEDAGMMRVFAATIPYLALLPAVGSLTLSRWIAQGFQQATPANARRAFLPGADEPSSAAEQSPLAATEGLAFCLVFALLAGPLLIKGLWAAKEKIDLKITCPPGETAAVIVLPRGSWIALVDEASTPTVRFPAVRYGDYLASVVQFHRPEAIAPLSSLLPGSILANTLDLREGFSFWVVLPQSVQAQADEPLEICGHWHPKFKEIGLGFLLAETWAGLK